MPKVGSASFALSSALLNTFDINDRIRGQVTTLVRQMCHSLPHEAMFGMWEWGTR